MKKALKIILAIFLLLILTVFIWTHLPFEIQRRSEINKGNVIVKNLNAYFKMKGQLPEDGDWKSLEGLGFAMGDIGTQPDYKKLSDTSFQLAFLEGFDGPYLTYKSVTGKWSVEYYIEGR